MAGNPNAILNWGACDNFETSLRNQNCVFKFKYGVYKNVWTGNYYIWPKQPTTWGFGEHESHIHIVCDDPGPAQRHDHAWMRTALCTLRRDTAYTRDRTAPNHLYFPPAAASGYIANMLAAPSGTPNMNKFQDVCRWYRTDEEENFSSKTLEGWPAAWLTPAGLVNNAYLRDWQALLAAVENALQVAFPIPGAVAGAAPAPGAVYPYDLRRR